MAGRTARGQALVESAIALGALVVVALALAQLAIYVHAEQVVIGACQDGARAASADGATLDEGTATARALLQAGLGPSAGAVTLDAVADSRGVEMTARGELPMVLPWLGNPALPLHARVTLAKEGFRAGPGR